MTKGTINRLKSLANPADTDKESVLVIGHDSKRWEVLTRKLGNVSEKKMTCRTIPWVSREAKFRNALEILHKHEAEGSIDPAQSKELASLLIAYYLQARLNPIIHSMSNRVDDYLNKVWKGIEVSHESRKD